MLVLFRLRPWQGQYTKCWAAAHSFCSDMVSRTFGGTRNVCQLGYALTSLQGKHIVCPLSRPKQPISPKRSCAASLGRSVSNVGGPWAGQLNLVLECSNFEVIHSTFSIWPSERCWPLSNVRSSFLIKLTDTQPKDYGVHWSDSAIHRESSIWHDTVS